MNWRTDLPAQIKVIVIENNMGHVLLRPVDPDHAAMVADSNEYDHTSDIYLQNSQDIQDLLESYPQARYRVNKSGYDDQYHIGRYYYKVNDGVKFYIDSWDFRHMVGGQSD